ncbi:PDDEXK nuclease domain-containing protein [Chitinophaga ginsengisegetis]|uniref:PDDEXK nuclease domain-containing protein n=1 Tax=Chitinophaga ginsengisegetis TaxID=393003 RepID=UPI00190EEFB6|nr:PDDEXK nuclease domain-containing protein [Chitinophaga ginsengisegetis]
MSIFIFGKTRFQRIYQLNGFFKSGEKQEGEQSPIGLILCAESRREQVELFEMHKDGIMVAEYWTELPPKKNWRKKYIISSLKLRKELSVRRRWSNTSNAEHEEIDHWGFTKT